MNATPPPKRPCMLSGKIQIVHSSSRTFVQFLHCQDRLYLKQVSEIGEEKNMVSLQFISFFIFSALKIIPFNVMKD
jgi:hypothetical protein